MELREVQDRLKRQERQVNDCERAAEKYKAHTDQFMAWRDALLDNLKKAQTAYDDARKAYEEAKAAADKATSPEITQPTETTPPAGSAQPSGTTLPTNSPTSGKDARPSSTKQANAGGKLANNGRHSAERNRTRRHRRHRTRNSHRGCAPHQELKVATSERRLCQSASPKSKEAPLPQLKRRKRASLLVKTDANAAVS